MKKLLATFALAVVLAPQAALARSMSGVQIHVVKDERALAKKCDYKINDEYSIDGCYDNRRRIYVRGDLAPDVLAFTIQHEIGHVYLQGVKDLSLFTRKEMEDGEWRDPEEVAADHFVQWIMTPAEVAPAERAFFERITKQK